MNLYGVPIAGFGFYLSEEQNLAILAPKMQAYLAQQDCELIGSFADDIDSFFCFSPYDLRRNRDYVHIVMLNEPLTGGFEVIPLKLAKLRAFLVENGFIFVDKADNECFVEDSGVI